MHTLMTDEQIREMLPEADNVVITGESNHKEIGIRMGTFSKTASINSWYGPETQRMYIRETVRELKSLNRQLNSQQQAAKKAAQ